MQQGTANTLRSGAQARLGQFRVSFHVARLEAGEDRAVGVQELELLGGDPVAGCNARRQESNDRNPG
jgi:hypothetical protein